MDETSDKHRKRQDLLDYGHEVAGIETGRIPRFGIGAARKQELKDKEHKERAYRHALERLLLDPAYRRLYQQLGERLIAAETDADTAIATVEEQLRLVGQEIQNIERAAARDPDGRQVFQFADGRVVYADGSEVSTGIAEGIIWPEHAPSAKDYFAAKDRQSGLQLQLDEWQVYRNDVLGGIRDRYDDREKPFEDKDALKDALDQIEKLKPSQLDPKPDTAPIRSSDIAVDAFPTIPRNGQ
ncbi:MAG: hypothetical protein AAF636_20580 [Pseudomonadota bacterium]